MELNIGAAMLRLAILGRYGGVFDETGPDNMLRVEVEVAEPESHQRSACEARIPLPALRRFTLDLIRTSRQLERTATIHALGGDFSMNVDQAEMWAPVVSVHLVDASSGQPIEVTGATTARSMRAFEKSLTDDLAAYPTTPPPPSSDEAPVRVDVQHVDWFGGRQAIGCVEETPSHYEAYALMLHPIGSDPGERFDPGPDDRQLQAARSPFVLYWSNKLPFPLEEKLEKRIYWREVAERFGFPYDARLVQRAWELMGQGKWPNFMYAPAEGTLEAFIARPLLRHLAPATGAQPCFFYYCFMYCLGDREELEGDCLQGSLASAMTFFENEDYRESSPTFWWPEDRSWFINTGYDSTYTIIGGTRELIDALCSDPELECFSLEAEAVRQGRLTLET